MHSLRCIAFFLPLLYYVLALSVDFSITGIKIERFSTYVKPDCIFDFLLRYFVCVCVSILSLCCLSSFHILSTFIRFTIKTLIQLFLSHSLAFRAPRRLVLRVRPVCVSPQVGRQMIQSLRLHYNSISPVRCTTQITISGFLSFFLLFISRSIFFSRFPLAVSPDFFKIIFSRINCNETHRPSERSLRGTLEAQEPRQTSGGSATASAQSDKNQSEVK